MIGSPYPARLASVFTCIPRVLGAGGSVSSPPSGGSGGSGRRGVDSIEVSQARGLAVRSVWKLDAVPHEDPVPEDGVLFLLVAPALRRRVGVHCDLERTAEGVLREVDLAVFRACQVDVDLP